MAGDNHGIEKTQDAKATENDGYEQTQESQSQVSGTDWEKAIAERDEKIAALERQVADAAKNAEAAEALRGEIAELKAQGESDHIDFKLQLAGVRNVKSARAILVDHGGDVVSVYANLDAAPCVSVGQSVHGGDAIGAIGATALAESGEEAHLHFAMRRGGSAVDPGEYLPEA